MLARRIRPLTLGVRHYALAASTVNEPLLKPMKPSITLEPLSANALNTPNKIYSIPYSAKDTQAINLLPVSVLRSFSELNSSGLLLRDSTKAIWNDLISTESYACMLEGPRGIGKSSTLLQLVCALASAQETRQFLVLYAPSMARWTAGYYPYYKNKDDPTVFDQPELASEIILLFQYINKNLPKEIEEALGSDQEPVAKLSTLLSTLSNLQSHRPVLVLDQLNALFCSTQYRNEESMTLVPDNFSVLAALRSAMKNTGFSVVGATCNADPLIREPTWDDNAQRLLANKISLQPMSTQEVAVLLEYYRALGHSYKTSPKYNSLLQFVSGGIPGNLAKACSFEQIYTQ